MTADEQVFTYALMLAGVRQVVEGDLPSVTPDVSVNVSQEDLYAIFSGTLPPLQAYLSGRQSHNCLPN